MTITKLRITFRILSVCMVAAVFATWDSSDLANVLATSYFSQEATAQAHGDPTTESREQEDRDFLLNFRGLPAEERVQLWKDSNTFKFRHSLARRLEPQIQYLLIAEGTDTVPYLAALIRDQRAQYFYRFWSVRLLSDMDRYVAADSMPVGAKATIDVQELNVSGAINPFLSVTGRRIGEVGFQAVRWASEQTKDTELSTHARNALGLIGTRYSNLALTEQVRLWRNFTARSKGAANAGIPSEPGIESYDLGTTIVGHAPESLDALTDILKNEKDPYVLESAVLLVRTIDLRRMRLRMTAAGQATITAVHQVLASRNIKPDYDTLDKRNSLWTRLSDQFYNDNFGADPTSDGAYDAQMLHELYGEKTVIIHEGSNFQWAVPAFHEFITYLTGRDTFFPSWEYTYCASSMYDQAFHPLFRKKMDRMEEAWKQFETERLPR